jgi:hypothetical protein
MQILEIVFSLQITIDVVMETNVQLIDVLQLVALILQLFVPMEMLAQLIDVTPEVENVFIFHVLLEIQIFVQLQLVMQLKDLF